MKLKRFRSCAIFLCAALLLGCAVPFQQLSLPSNTTDSESFARLQAASSDLLYVSDLGANSVDYFSYPKGELVGKLTGFGSVAGLCANKSGAVFVVDEAGPVQMFAHGGTHPIRKLQTSGAPYGCAVDPITGNLALTQLSSYEHGAIAIYPKAKGPAKIYRDTTIDATWFCGYDDQGNLFADAWNRIGTNILIALPKGSETLTKFDLPKGFKNPGGVQWDGKFLAVVNRGAGLIYRISKGGSIVATIRLKSGTNVEQSWIQGSTLVGPNAQSQGTVSFWRYPAGGNPTKTLSGFTYPFGAAVSIAR